MISSGTTKAFLSAVAEQLGVPDNREVFRTLGERLREYTEDELTSTLTTGISINHLISIISALIGGMLWKRYGYGLLFSFAVPRIDAAYGLMQTHAWHIAYIILTIFLTNMLA